MKFTRKFLDGYITYDENDAFFEADGCLDLILKTIFSLVYGTILGVFFFFVLGVLAYLAFSFLVWLLCLIL